MPLALAPASPERSSLSGLSMFWALTKVLRVATQNFEHYLKLITGSLQNRGELRWLQVRQQFEAACDEEISEYLSVAIVRIDLGAQEAKWAVNIAAPLHKLIAFFEQVLLIKLSPIGVAAELVAQLFDPQIVDICAGQ
jgi:hypothetical protein